MEVPILKTFDPMKSLILSRDVSNGAIGAILEMCVHNSNKVIDVVAYLSRSLYNHELNWPIREKEFFAIVHALRKWRRYLLGTGFLLCTDHESLQYIMKEKVMKQLLIKPSKNILREYYWLNMIFTI